MLKLLSFSSYSKSFFLLLAFISTGQLSAQIDTLTFDTTDNKQVKGDIRINFSNVGLSNWTGGGQDALSLGSEFDYKFERNWKKRVFETELNVVYGVTKIEGFDQFRKTDDQFTLRSLYGKQSSKHAFITLFTEMWSQMTNGFEFDDSTGEETKRLVSRPLAPGYINANLGYTYKKQNLYSLTISPFTSKLTVVLDDSLANIGAFGVDPGQKTRFEGGLGFNGSYRNEILKNVDFSSTVNLFANYNNPLVVDVNLRASLKMRVNEIISSSFSVALIYDEDVDVVRDDGTTGPAIQFRNVINVGLYFDLWKIDD